MARKKFSPCDFVERCPICRKAMAGALGVGTGPTWTCERHGRMTRMEQERIPYTRHKTSLGECLVVEDLEVYDAYDEVRDSKLNVFLPEEWDDLLHSSPEDRKETWEKRERALEKERRLRELDSSRTVYGSMDGK